MIKRTSDSCGARNQMAREVRKGPALEIFAGILCLA